MLYIKNLEVVGWEAAIRGMRNPMNSWDRSDSFWDHMSKTDIANNFHPNRCILHTHSDADYVIGVEDQKLMIRLAKAGTDHRKFMRMIIAYMDITAPLYWWKEFDTYKVGTVANSCSTMHKIADKKFELYDFSYEHILDDKSHFTNKHGDKYSALTLFEDIIVALNLYRDLYLQTKDKVYWWQMIQMLPSSYNQKRTVMLSYEALANIYSARKNHKLDEWHTFCDAIELAAPHSYLITGKVE